MFGSLGAPEIILIFVVALLVFGPKRLPEIGRKFGGVLRELRRSTGDFRASVEREIGLDPASTGADEIQRARRDLLSVVSEPLRDVTSGARQAVREVREFREAVILPPEPPEPIPAPAGSVPAASPSARPGAEPDAAPAVAPDAAPAVAPEGGPEDPRE